MQNSRSQRFIVIDVLKTLGKFYRITLMLESLLNKVLGLPQMFFKVGALKF